MIWAILGVALAAAGLVWAIWARWHDRDRAERKCAEELLNWLEGRRVLWTPVIEELPEEAIGSILEIRDRVEQDYGALQNWESRRQLERIRSACLSILGEPREHFAVGFSPEGERALDSFRQQVRPAVESLASTYGLQAPSWASFHGGFADPGETVHLTGPGE